MQIQTEQLIPLGFDPDGPTVRVVHFSKADKAILIKAAALLEGLRKAWNEDDDHPLDTDVALAMYTIRDLMTDERLEI